MAGSSSDAHPEHDTDTHAQHGSGSHGQQPVSQPQSQSQPQPPHQSSDQQLPHLQISTAQRSEPGPQPHQPLRESTDAPQATPATPATASEPFPTLSNTYSFPRVSSSTDRDAEFIGEKRPETHRLDTLHSVNQVPRPSQDIYNVKSPTNLRADASRLDDDLELLRAERLISHQEQELEKNRSTRQDYERHDTQLEDAFNPAAGNEAKLVKRRDESAPLYKFWLFLKKFPRFFRYFVYLLPGAVLLLIPILMAVLAIDQNENPVGGYGGTPLMWFGIWLQIVWGALWVSRMITSLLPPLFQSLARVTGSTNPKKWKDVGRHMELHTALFLWLLAVLISFKPVVANHRVPVPEGREDDVDREWINIVFKIIIAFFVLATLNFVEKIIIQWIATAFHERTYATRIENNKGDIRQLVALYDHAKSSLEETDSFWNEGSGGQSVNGTQTPMQNFHENARQVLGKVGQVAGKVGNDFIGRKVDNNHPRKVVSELLRTTASAHTLARLIYRSLAQPGNEMVFLDDVHRAFATKEEAEAAFNVFDKDLNGDISMEEFETVTNEIGMEKKAIAASLKDLDSVIQKLDKVFLFIIIVVTIIVFISIISGSAAAGLASAGSSVLGLAWMLQATAQEFLQSIIFVFVKHPFDVGDRVTIYGSTGATMTGDDYYVTEISLLYTEFKKLQGHVVQAPNSLLNTLFILNQRRSNGLADPIPLTIRFGTPAWQIDELKARMLDFCLNNKRDYQPTILMELSKIEDVRAATLTVVFIHKSNFQNELLRLARLNKFMMELMAQMADIGIQSPFRIEPGGSREHPMHWTGPQPPPSYTQTDQGQDQPPAPQEAPQPSTSMRRPSVTSGGGSMRHPARQTTSADMALNNFGDVFENRREHFLASRLASIREKTQAEKKLESKKAKQGSELGSEGGHGSTSALAPAGSVNSQSRSRMWQRPRGNSRFAPPPTGGQGDDHIV